MFNELFIQATTMLASVATYWCDTIKRRVMVYDRHYNKPEYKYWACRDLYAGFNCVVHCNLEWKFNENKSFKQLLGREKRCGRTHDSHLSIAKILRYDTNDTMILLMQ